MKFGSLARINESFREHIRDKNGMMIHPMKSVHVTIGTIVEIHNDYSPLLGIYMVIWIPTLAVFVAAAKIRLQPI